MIIFFQGNIGGFAGNMRYLWIGQQFLGRRVSITSVSVSAGAANWSSNYNLLLDIIN